LNCILIPSAKSGPLRKIKRPQTPKAIAVFARTPVPGATKTRLIPLLGERGAASLQAALLADTLHKLSRFKAGATLHLFTTGRKPDQAQAARFPAAVSAHRQHGSGLGERLQSAFRKLFKLCHRAIIIGTDSPLLSPHRIHLALCELEVCDAVLGPCPDGGYYLIGLRAAHPESRRLGFLRNVRWSSPHAFEDTLRLLLERGFSCSILEEQGDVDLPADVEELKQRLIADSAARRLAPETWRFLRDAECALARLRAQLNQPGSGANG
jgi:rSAM/selenodomain-associated transferase 1